MVALFLVGRLENSSDSLKSRGQVTHPASRFRSAEAIDMPCAGPSTRITDRRPRRGYFKVNSVILQVGLSSFRVRYSPNLLQYGF